MKEFSGIYNIYLKKKYWNIYINHKKMAENILWERGIYERVVCKRVVGVSCVRELCVRELCVWEDCVWGNYIWESVCAVARLFFLDAIFVTLTGHHCGFEWSFFERYICIYLYIFVYTYIHTYISHPRKTYNSNWFELITRKP